MESRLVVKRPNDHNLYDDESTVVEEIMPGDDAPGPARIPTRKQLFAAKLDEIELGFEAEMHHVNAFLKRKEEEKKKSLGKPRPSMSVKTMKRMSPSPSSFFPASSPRLALPPAKLPFNPANIQPAFSNRYPKSDSPSSSSCSPHVMPAYETTQDDSGSAPYIPGAGMAQLPSPSQPSGPFSVLTSPPDIKMNGSHQAETLLVDLSHDYRRSDTAPFGNPEHEAAGNLLDLRVHSTFQGSQSALRAHSMLQSESLQLDKQNSKLELPASQEERKVCCCCFTISKFW
jgi:hypothetical protein